MVSPFAGPGADPRPTRPIRPADARPDPESRPLSTMDRIRVRRPTGRIHGRSRPPAGRRADVIGQGARAPRSRRGRQRSPAIRQQIPPTAPGDESRRRIPPDPSRPVRAAWRTRGPGSCGRTADPWPWARGPDAASVPGPRRDRGGLRPAGSTLAGVGAVRGDSARRMEVDRESRRPDYPPSPLSTIAVSRSIGGASRRPVQRLCFASLGRRLPPWTPALPISRARPLPGPAGGPPRRARPNPRWPR
jgi:hypothetical protein